MTYAINGMSNPKKGTPAHKKANQDTWRSSQTLTVRRMTDEELAANGGKPKRLVENEKG